MHPETVSDIFISYARPDRAKAQMLAKALEELGWSVWWDPKIRPGKTFHEVIESGAGSGKVRHRFVVTKVGSVQLGNRGSYRRKGAKSSRPGFN